MGQGLFFFKQRPYTESVTFPIRVGTNIVDSRCKIVKIKNKNVTKRLNLFYPSPSIFKLKDLGWTPKVNVKTGFTKTLSFLLQKKKII